MAKDLIYYQNLVTSEFRDKPDFMKMVELNTAVARRVQELLATLIPRFDVDEAVGVQLDVIGQWVGISRKVSIPIAGVYFSWDGADDVGWEYGTWQPANAPVDITLLPDDAYRTLIRAKIAANQWDGTTTGAYEIWNIIFPELTILIQDNQNMSYDLIILGAVIDSLTLALITGGYIPLKPEGVRVNSYIVVPEIGPVFAWDVDPETDLLAGWDTGQWPLIIQPT